MKRDCGECKDKTSTLSHLGMCRQDDNRGRYPLFITVLTTLQRQAISLYKKDGVSVCRVP